MPRKYRPEREEYMFFASAISVYGMLRPVEERLKKGGYIGNVLADYNRAIYYDLGEEANSPLFYDDRFNNAGIDHSGSFKNNGYFMMKQPLTRTGEKEFRNYLKKMRINRELFN